MKKQALSLLLALSLISVPVLAAENSTDNFTRSKTYASQFSDLPEDHTFYENVAALYEYGLSVGQADGTYGLSAPMTVGQAVIFAGASAACTAPGTRRPVPPPSLPPPLD